MVRKTRNIKGAAQKSDRARLVRELNQGRKYRRCLYIPASVFHAARDPESVQVRREGQYLYLEERDWGRQMTLGPFGARVKLGRAAHQIEDVPDGYYRASVSGDAIVIDLLVCQSETQQKEG